MAFCEVFRRSKTLKRRIILLQGVLNGGFRARVLSPLGRLMSKRPARQPSYSQTRQPGIVALMGA